MDQVFTNGFCTTILRKSLQLETLFDSAIYQRPFQVQRGNRYLCCLRNEWSRDD